jgi:hypothetical protein
MNISSVGEERSTTSTNMHVAGACRLMLIEVVVIAGGILVWSEHGAAADEVAAGLEHPARGVCYVRSCGHAGRRIQILHQPGRHCRRGHPGIGLVPSGNFSAAKPKAQLIQYLGIVLSFDLRCFIDSNLSCSNLCGHDRQLL